MTNVNVSRSILSFSLSLLILPVFARSDDPLFSDSPHLVGRDPPDDPFGDLLARDLFAGKGYSLGRGKQKLSNVAMPTLTDSQHRERRLALHR